MALSKELKITTIIMWDLNINAWIETEKEEYVKWLVEEQLWELSDPRVPTYRVGAATDGILLAIGEYMPDGLLPQEAGLEMDGGHPDAYPAVVSPEPVLVDRHALWLDIHTVQQMEMPRIEKYNVETLTKKEWGELDQEIEQDPRQRTIQYKDNTRK